MKNLLLILAVAVLTPALANAQSSGSYTYGNTGGTHCVLNGQNGAITGGATCSSGVDCSALGCTPIPAFGGACTVDSDCASKYCVNPTGVAGAGQCAVGTCGGSIVAGISVNVQTSSAYAGVDFSLAVTPPAGAPAPCISPNYSVTYASRFIQISTNLFTVLGNLCTTISNNNQVGGVTDAVGCFISFSESTVSANSFDWIVGYPDGNAVGNGNTAKCGTLSSGVYGIAANWKAALGNTGISQSLTCVGPVNLSVTQNKIFSFNTVN